MDTINIVQRNCKNCKNDSPKCGTQEGEETLVHQELTNCEIDYDQYH